MPESLYRFRSLDRLLRQGELEKQEIYFAAPSELNDPVEGYLDLFWQGDAIVWENLFRHYLLILEQAILLCRLSNEGDPPLRPSRLNVFSMPSTLPTESYKATFKAMADVFIGSKNVTALTNEFGNRNRKIRRDELVFYLKLIHAEAIAAISAVNDKSGSAVVVKTTADIPKLLDHAAKAGEIHGDDGQPIGDIMYHVTRSTMHELDLIRAHEETEDGPGTNRHFVLRQFPDVYVQELERLLWPPWYAACFVEKIDNAAVWGHYGDGHRGVCLKFKTYDVSPNRVGMNLLGISGYGWSRDKGSWTNRGYQHYPVEQIVYGRPYPEVDFFRSLLRLTVGQLLTDWYTTPAGGRSPIADEVIQNEEWRLKYWQTHRESVTTKLKEWEYEGERRVVLQSSLSDHEDVTDRLLTYKFSDLEAIVFGMKTPVEEKLKIVKIIERKCKENNCYDIKFYQAFYAHATGTIGARHEIRATERPPRHN